MSVHEVQRRLAAILVADVAGYSRLVEQDETATLAAVRDIRLQIFEPLMIEHRGRIVKVLGDGIIAEFGSVVAAVACAATVQAQLALRQHELPPERKITLRIGVNLGDVVVEGDDLLGDGVNVAARLEQLCPPGGVLISGSAHDQLVGKLEARFEYVGEQRLKNIARPVRAYQLVVAGAGAPLAFRQEKPVIAVLPFENMSGAPEQAYFSDGITEDVITELSRFGELMVIARNSSYSFRGKVVDSREIGRQLGAAYLVEGSVRRANDRVRITAQLVEAVSGSHLWAERYDRAMVDVFAIQEEIAQSIVATVAQRIKDDWEVAARRRPPEDIRAYDLFLQGLRFSDNFTADAQRRAHEFFERARQIDPTFARAYTGLAYIYLNRAVDSSIGVPREQDANRIAALRLAEEALALDPNDPRVQSTLGFICLTWRDFDRAERHSGLAKAMNPNDPEIQINWASVQSCVGRAEQALEAAEIASRLNPRYPGWYNYYVSRILFLLGRYEEAAGLLEKRTLDAPHLHPRDMAWRVAAYGHLGRIDEAKQCGEIFIRSVGSNWRGAIAAGAAQYVDWVVDVSYLKQRQDVERFRAGLRIAGLPA